MLWAAFHWHTERLRLSVAITATGNFIVRSDALKRIHGEFFYFPPHLSHFFSSLFRTLIFVPSALLPFSSTVGYLHLRSFVPPPLPSFFIPSLIQSINLGDFEKPVERDCYIMSVCPYRTWRCPPDRLLRKFYICIILVNDQLDIQFFFSYMFIPNLYMFRAHMCPSSGELIVSIRHLVYVTLYRWPFSLQVWVEPKHTRRSSIQSDMYQMSYLYN
jgi:hypothetical protein